MRWLCIILVVQLLISEQAVAQFSCEYNCHIGLIIRRGPHGEPLYYTTNKGTQFYTKITDKNEPNESDPPEVLKKYEEDINAFVRADCLDNLVRNYPTISYRQTKDDDNLIYATPVGFVGRLDCKRSAFSKENTSNDKSLLYYICKDDPIMTIEPTGIDLGYIPSEYSKIQNTTIGKKCMQYYFDDKKREKEDAKSIKTP